MNFTFPTFIRQRMESLALSRKDSVLQMGYRNLCKGLRRLDSWLECRAWPNGPQLEQLAALLQTSGSELIGLIRQDIQTMLRLEDEERALDPRYFLDMRVACAVFRKSLPSDLTESEALEQARVLVREKRLRGYLNLPSNQTYIIDAKGNVLGRFRGPGAWMSIKGKAFTFGACCERVLEAIPKPANCHCERPKGARQSLQNK